jgi:hypothetical protein
MDFAGNTVDAILGIVGQGMPTHARVSCFLLQNAVREEAMGPYTFLLQPLPEGP